MNTIQALAISTDLNVCSLIHSVLEGEGHRARCVSSAQDALDLLQNGLAVDLLLIDQPRRRSYEQESVSNALLGLVDPSRVCLLDELGDYSGKQKAEAKRVGTVLTKPLLRHDLEKLLSRTVFTASVEPGSALHESNQDYVYEELDNGRFFLAASPSMLQIYKNIHLLAPVDVPVLILGESGVGKEIVSLLLHKYSARAQKSFINVNCAALPSDLLESELFGYEAGAFTGAVKSKPGKFDIAHKGTLLLDEIGEMSAAMQAKLLHVLQDGQFCRLGARTTTQTDVRVLAATNIDMKSAIAEHRFREDLYYRLNAFAITIPPLRERREEIPLLIEHMLRRGAAQLKQAPYTFSTELMAAAQAHSWPGNLRELNNFVTRTLILRDHETALQEVLGQVVPNSTSRPTKYYSDAPIESPGSGVDGMRSIVRGVKDKAEIHMIQNALDASGWNRRRAAMNLNISYRGLLYKIQQYGLTPQYERLSMR